MSDENKEKSGPMISMFHHKHGTSVAVIPGGQSPEQYWKDTDSHDPEDEDGNEYIETSELEMPYAAAPELLAVLKDTLEYLEANPDEYSNKRAKKAREIIAKAEGRS